MWEYIDKDFIRHVETGLYFENSQNDLDWQIRYDCWHKAIVSLAAPGRYLRLRQIRTLELECSLWALDRSPPTQVAKKTFVPTKKPTHELDTQFPFSPL